MRKSVYSLILTTFLATSSFAGDQHFDDLSSLPSGSQQSTHSVVPALGDPNAVIDTGLTQESTRPKLRRRGSGNDRGGCASSRGLTRADFKAQQEEEKTKPTHRRRPSGDKSGGGSGNGDRGGCAAKLVESHAEFSKRAKKPDLKRVPSGQHGESTGKPPLKRVPSGHHGEGPVENSMENSNDFFAYVHAYRQGLPIESH